MSHRPPKNDTERLQNLIEALAEPGDDDDDAFDEEMRAELARHGLTLESWAAQIRVQAQAVLDKNRRARRMRALKIAVAGVAGLAAAAGVGLALQSSAQTETADVSAARVESNGLRPPRVVLDAGVDAPRRK